MERPRGAGRGAAPEEGRSLSLALLLLLACDPLGAHRQAERGWSSADRLAAEEGLDLVPLEAGEPLRPWFRMTVRKDRVDVDDRAWILSLSPELARELPPIVQVGALTPGGGYERLHEVLGPLVARANAIADPEAPRGPGVNLFVDRDADPELFWRASHASSMWGDLQFVGRVGDLPMGTSAVRDDVTCHAHLALRVAPGGAVLRTWEGAAVSSADTGAVLIPPGAEGLDRFEAMFRQVEGACRPHWQALARRVTEATPGGVEVAPERWQCFRVWMWVQKDVPPHELLPLRARIYRMESGLESWLPMRFEEVPLGTGGATIGATLTEAEAVETCALSTMEQVLSALRRGPLTPEDRWIEAGIPKLYVASPDLGPREDLWADEALDEPAILELLEAP